ncbi:MAG: hypothetical protein RBT30_03235 [Patescibacteria group bacterium]|jgi:hypothetical protein|nr:hypothetical protein [Patescibacteria group bacterium]
MQKVINPLLPERNNLFKMYFTENVIGKYSIYIPELALNNVLEKKCATEEKRKATISMIDNIE